MVDGSIGLILGVAVTAVILTGVSRRALGQTNEEWRIVVGDGLRQDEAIRVALEDLRKTGAELGLLFEVVDESAELGGNVLLVGDASRNAVVARLVAQQKLALEAVDDEQGYEIATVEADGRRTMVVGGGSVVGDVYGLYWVWDRMRVFKHLPSINVRRTPALKMRVGAAWGRRSSGGGTKGQMRRALRYGMNWVSGPAIMDLVPWGSEPERTRNAEFREETRELIAYAHALHMKYFAFANEFTYHPTLLEEFGASLSLSDPKFWDALQAKFRRLFEALPELDGIELCNDDISAFWDDYRPFDVMHDDPASEWPYDKRFRTFVKKVHDVVVGEFGKTYFHFTWSLVTYDQHSQADVYRQIFTDDVPVDNLYLLPKITTADRWWHQPYNPTFNQTPHSTIVTFETMNYYEGGPPNLFPTFSGQYFQAGLQTFLRPEDHNVKGTASLTGMRGDGWESSNASVYVLYRLAWDPYQDVEEIARDFCSIHFGPAAADAMAEIVLLSPVAYKYGLHIEPVSYGQFNSLLHMRVGTFPAEGYPRIDGGREHIEFLHDIYLRCKPWEAETLDDLDHGLATAARMVGQFQSVKPLIENAATAQSVEDRLNMTQLLIKTNNLYVKTTFAFFAYLETPTAENRAALADVFARFDGTRSAFIGAPGFYYQLFGVDVLLASARAALDDVETVRRTLKEAPSRATIDRTIAGQQRLYEEVLAKHEAEAVQFAHVEIEVDGRDILKISGDRHELEHLRWDPAALRDLTFLAPLPRERVTVIPKNIQSRPMHPFILEQPCEANDFTVEVYLYDEPGGKDWMKFDLYCIPKPPQELGLQIPWQQ